VTCEDAAKGLRKGKEYVPVQVDVQRLESAKATRDMNASASRTDSVRTLDSIHEKENSARRMIGH
jgi:hypothetical protein